MSYQILKKSIYMGVFCLFSVGASAQMLDAMSALGVQGALTQGSVKSVHQGLTYLEKTQLLGQINQLAMEIKMIYPNGYTGLSKRSFDRNPFPKMSWEVGDDGKNQFFISFSNIDQSTCQYLVSSQLESTQTLVNNRQGDSKNCQKSNRIRFIFN